MVAILHPASVSLSASWMNIPEAELRALIYDPESEIHGL